MPDFDRLHKLAHRLAQLTAPGQQNPGLSSWCMFVGEDWKALAEMWSPIIAPEPVPALPPSSGVSDAPAPVCDCNVELRNLARRPIHDPIEIRFLRCPLHEAAPDLYAAVEELLKAGAHEGPCDNCDPETGEPYDEAGACEAHLKACEARRVIARTALAKARGEKPNAK